MFSSVATESLSSDHCDLLDSYIMGSLMCICIHSTQSSAQGNSDQN